MKAVVIGTGAWGTAIAMQASRSSTIKSVNILARNSETVKEINTFHTNNNRLKDIKLSSKIHATDDINILSDADLIFSVTPSSVFRENLIKYKQIINKNSIFVICSKGIEQESFLTLNEVAQSIIPNNPICVMSGPTFAIEVANDIPTAIVVAGQDKHIKIVANAIKSKNFRPYLNNDVKGVEIAGSMKNILAIACGIITGIGMGNNTNAALITRGCTEISKFITKLGGHEDTINGLAGFGDILLTCNSTKSRNMAFGIKIGQGNNIKETITNSESVIEGVYACQNFYKLAKKLNISMPICNAVKNIIIDYKLPQDIINDLLDRPIKYEI